MSTVNRLGAGISGARRFAPSARRCAWAEPEPCHCGTVTTVSGRTAGTRSCGTTGVMGNDLIVVRVRRSAGYDRWQNAAVSNSADGSPKAHIVTALLRDGNRILL